MPGWTTPRTWTDGELVTKAIMDPHIRDNLNFIRPLLARKTANQTKVSSTVLEDVTNMSFAIGASETWAVQMRSTCSIFGTPDAKFHWTFPSGATGHTWLESGGAGNTQVSIASDLVIAGSGGDMGISIHATIINSTTPGTVQLQWAQNTSDAATNTFYSNAVLIAQRIA